MNFVICPLKESTVDLKVFLSKIPFFARKTLRKSDIVWHARSLDSTPGQLRWQASVVGPHPLTVFFLYPAKKFRINFLHVQKLQFGQLSKQILIALLKS